MSSTRSPTSHSGGSSFRGERGDSALIHYFGPLSSRTGSCSPTNPPSSPSQTSGSPPPPEPMSSSARRTLKASLKTTTTTPSRGSGSTKPARSPISLATARLLLPSSLRGRTSEAKPVARTRSEVAPRRSPSRARIPRRSAPPASARRAVNETAASFRTARGPANGFVARASLLPLRGARPCSPTRDSTLRRSAWPLLGFQLPG